MKAVVVYEPGDASVLKYVDVPKISFIEQFHSEINPLFNQIKNNKLQNITLLQIKKDMLNKYFQ